MKNKRLQLVLSNYKLFSNTSMFGDLSKPTDSNIIIFDGGTAFSEDIELLDGGNAYTVDKLIYNGGNAFN